MRRWNALRATSRPLVLKAQPAGTVRVEVAENGAELARAQRVAVVAHWDADRRVGRSTRTLVELLVQAGYVTMLVSATAGPGSLDWEGCRPPLAAVIRRPNVGYDFGSWATALDWFPAIGRARSVLLLNDSLVGPFGPIDHLLDRFDRSHADVWGIVDSYQLAYHLQSFCLGFKGGCLERAPLKRFWRGIRVEASRDDVIRRYEIGLTQLLERNRFEIDVAIPVSRVVEGDYNPTMVGWRRLLDGGFPFVKRQILLEPGVYPGGELVRGELRRRYGVEADEWL